MDYSRSSDAPISAVLIGCGRIGSAFDEGRPDNRGLTHAGAIAVLPGVELVAVCDVDADRAVACARAHKVRHVFHDVCALFDAVRADLVCIATPTELGRYSIIEHALAAGARAIFCEKPVAVDLAEAKAIAEMVPRDMVFAVNYLRSWSPGLETALQWFGEGCIGLPQRVLVQYDKGFSNNGSHAIDLLRHFVGWPTRLEVLRVQGDSHSRSDPTVDVACTWDTGGTPVRGYLLSSDYRHFSTFAVELLGTSGSIRFEDRGRTVRLDQVAPDPDFAGFSVLRPAGTVTHGLEGAVTRAMADTIAALGNESPPRLACSLQDAVTTMESVEQAREQARRLL